MKRIFSAIKINFNDEQLKHIVHLKNQLITEQIKWVNMDQIHFTLHFFGETRDELIPDIIEEYRSIASQIHAFDLQMKGIGIFGSKYKPKVIFVRLENDEMVMKLHGCILESLQHLCIEKNRENFVPHISLARVKAINRKKQFQEVIETFSSLDLGSCHVQEIILYESVLQQKRAVHKVIESFSLEHSL